MAMFTVSNTHWLCFNIRVNVLWKDSSTKNEPTAVLMIHKSCISKQTQQLSSQTWGSVGCLDCHSDQSVKLVHGLGNFSLTHRFLELSTASQGFICGWCSRQMNKPHPLNLQSVESKKLKTWCSTLFGHFIDRTISWKNYFILKVIVSSFGFWFIYTKAAYKVGKKPVHINNVQEWNMTE